MKKILSIFISVLSISHCSFSFAASLNSMDKNQVKQVFINKTFISIATDNLNGKTINNTFSMFLDDKGNIIGKMSSKPANQPQTDKGVYSIKEDGTLMITWQHWDEAKELCALFFETANAYIAMECNNVFHTAFMKEDIKQGNHLN